MKYLQHYPADLLAQIRTLIEQDKLADYLTKKYPNAHNYGNDKQLRAYAESIQKRYLKNTPALRQVGYDTKLTASHQALGLNTRHHRAHGKKLKTAYEIKISAAFKQVPEPFLRMILVHELAHLKEREHDKAFYKLCTHMEPNYHQIELDLRLYLTYLETNAPLY